MSYLTPDEKKAVEDQIRRMIKRGQILPRKYSQFTPDEIIEKWNHAKLIAAGRISIKALVILSPPKTTMITGV